MDTAILNGAIKLSPQYKLLVNRLRELRESNKPLPLLVDGVSDGALYSLIFSLIKEIKDLSGKPALILVPEERRANKLNEFFKRCALKSELYPVRDFNFYDMTASRELEHERLKVLSGVFLGDIDAVVTTPDALLQYTTPKEILEKAIISVDKKAVIDISAFSKKLFDMGYTPASRVEGAGQYSVRGGIVDIFPSKCEYTIGKKVVNEQMPIRIELFGDEIDRMVTFDIESQRAKDKITSFKITPSTEIVANDEQ